MNLRIATRRIYGFGHQDHRLERRGGRKGELGERQGMDAILNCASVWATDGGLTALGDWRSVHLYPSHRRIDVLPSTKARGLTFSWGL